MRMRFNGLWRDVNFTKLWTGQAISLFGSQITFLALPLTAVLVLDATPSQMGILMAVEALPTLLMGLFVGVWVDHYRRRPILIMADLGRAVLLSVIPVVAILGLLRIEHLYIVCFLVSVLALFFGVAHRSFLPSLVEREQLVEANSKLELSNSVAEIVGPGVAGGLVQVVTAPIAIAVDAISFLVSALLLGLIRVSEPVPKPAKQQNIWKEIGEGLELVLRDRLLRPIAGCLSTLYFFNSVLEAVFILYVSQEVGIGAGLLGLIFAVGSVGFLVGALLPGWIVRRFGWGPGIMMGLLLVGLSDLLVPLVSGSVVVAVAVVVLMTAQFFFGLGLVIFNAGQVSLRQAMTPDELQGRMNATMSFIAGAVVPLGGLLGGALGETIGLRPTLLLAALGEILSVLWLLLSPMRSQREQPVSLD
ncbi:MAG TPA: MFS transporter [Anaerolineae bacterium]|nr:MFS transporter [Anaerolineae bacterium]